MYVFTGDEIDTDKCQITKLNHASVHKAIKRHTMEI